MLQDKISESSRLFVQMSYALYFAPVINMILFFTGVNNRISFVTYIPQLPKAVFMYQEITFFTGQNVQDNFNKIMFLQLSHIYHRFLLSVLQINFVDIHVCVYSSYK